MGGETRPEEARLQRWAHPKGRNGMQHPAQRGCARRDGPQAEAPATPADEGRPTNRRRRVSGRGDHHRAMRSSPKAETRHGARGRQSGLERGLGRRSRDAPRRQARNETHPCKRTASAAACARACGPAAAAPRPRKSAHAGQDAAAQRRQGSPIRSRVPSASPPSARRRSPLPLGIEIRSRSS